MEPITEVINTQDIVAGDWICSLNHGPFMKVVEVRCPAEHVVDHLQVPDFDEAEDLQLAGRSQGPPGCEAHLIRKSGSERPSLQTSDPIPYRVLRWVNPMRTIYTIIDESYDAQVAQDFSRLLSIIGMSMMPGEEWYCAAGAVNAFAKDGIFAHLEQNQVMYFYVKGELDWRLKVQRHQIP